MAVRWTKKQSEAIETRDKTLLVSAAAGSGKTATLTERIIQSVLDKDNPADISRMLIVTFTRAAAAELRERITAAIARALESDPENRHLSRQALLMPTAQICTIDSFCNDILSSHAAELGLSTSYRICDEAEEKLLEHVVMEEIVESAYEGLYLDIDKNGFALFAENMTVAKDEGALSEKLIFLYSKTSQLPDRLEVYKRILEILESEPKIFDTPWGEHLKKRLADFCGHYGRLCAHLLSKMSDTDADAEKKYEKCFSHVIEHTDLCIKAIEKGYENAAAAVALLCKLPERGRNKENERSEYSHSAEALHALLKTDAQALKKSFSYSKEDFSSLFSQMKDFYKMLILIFEKYEERLTREKRDRGILNFDDISRYTYNLLCNKDGTPTDIAKGLCDSYDYVYIDEYQDVNYIQHRIFESISRKNNRFMVGDIKQSIYGFRGGEPDIFASLRRKYPKLDVSEGDYATVFMSENFRCDESVIEFVNAVFDTLFERAGASIGYERDDRLCFSKVSDPPTHGKASVRVFENTKAEEDDGAEDTDAADAELSYVADEIKRLLSEELKNDTTPITPKDIAVIFRSGPKKMDRLRQMLEDRGVSAHAANKENFFLTPDVLLMLSILNSVDNPRRDVYLAGAMRSPVFNFTMDELVSLRNENPDAPSLYDALVAYTEAHPDYRRGIDFLGTLSELREFSRGTSVDKLISKIYSTTNILSVVQKRDRLMLLYNYAVKFEASSFKGLYNFISFVDEIIAEKRQLSLGDMSEDTESVTIMTAHHSKGLEFPVCFLCGAGSNYSNMDTRSDLLFDSELGVATKFLDSTGLLVVDNPVFDVLASRLKRRQAEEEMRILYVALTRARERLYVTATPRMLPKNIQKKVESLAKYADEYYILGEKNYISLILLAMQLYPDCANFEIISENDITANNAIARSPEDVPDSAVHTEEIAKIREGIERNLSFEYKYSYLNKLPGKLSVSRLYPEVLDESEDREITPVVNAEVTGRVPRFMSSQENEADGAQKGNATHLFLQFCDFENVCRGGVERELSRLVENRFITERDAALVRIYELECFFKSELFFAMRSARRIWRELRFNMKLPAEKFTADAELSEKLRCEELLVQGVIDCVFEAENGDIILSDYKTDRVPRDREEARAVLRERHSSQLGYYREVSTKMFGKAPAKVYIYSLALGESIEI